MRHIWTGWVMLACAGWVWPAWADAPPSRPATRPSLDALIEQLGDHRFSARDEATARLSKLPPEALDELMRRFREEPRHEQKLRLRVAIENVYYHKLMIGQTGFMGITPRSIARVYDPQKGQPVDCMLVVQVVPDNPAQRAGMRDGDILLDFDGLPITEFMKPTELVKNRPMMPAGVEQRVQDPGVEAFTAHVKMRAPGSEVKLRVLRAGAARQARAPVAADGESTAHERSLAPTVLSREGPGLARMLLVGGLVVTHVPERSWMAEADLRVNDMIVGIQGQAIEAGRTSDVLDAAFRAAARMPDQPGQITLEVRRLEEVELTLALGARPPGLMNPADWQEAQKRFAAWWRDEVGEVSLRLRRPGRAYFAGMAQTIPPEPDPEVVP